MQVHTHTSVRIYHCPNSWLPCLSPYLDLFLYHLSGVYTTYANTIDGKIFDKCKAGGCCKMQPPYSNEAPGINKTTSILKDGL